MAQIVVPFRGESGKQRLDAPDEIRSKLALAMLGDVLTACVATGRTFLVTQDDGRPRPRAMSSEPRSSTIREAARGLRLLPR